MHERENEEAREKQTENGQKREVENILGSGRALNMIYAY